MMTLVSGGSASGKSEFAESLVLASVWKNRFYLATMMVFDEECKKRIERHRLMRAKKNFQTIEVPIDLQKVSFPNCEGKIALLECMSNLTANEVFSPQRKASLQELEEKIVQGVSFLCEQCNEVIVVTNELFSDGIDYDSSTQEYLNLLGNINQRLALSADRVFEVTAGIPICWKGEQV